MTTERKKINSTKFVVKVGNGFGAVKNDTVSISIIGSIYITRC
jgi:hypothetical protein